LKNFTRYICYVLCFLLGFEITLQLISKKVSPYRSYSEFYDSALAKAEKTDPKKTVYFVGDSTIYGGGSSDSSRFSMPVQFEKLLKVKNSQMDVLNLGYPGTTGKHHIDVLRRLPEESLVIIRTGVNDSWNRYDYYKFYLFGKYYEIRSLKLLVILIHGWRKTQESTKVSKSYYDALNKVANEKKLNLFYVDYFLGIVTFMNESFLGKYNFINLPKILKDSGFFTPKGYIQRKYLSFDLFHANDLGYRLQAIAIYNFFCKQQSLGLSKEDLLPLKLNKVDRTNVESRVKVLRNKLVSQDIVNYGIYPDLLNATWQLYLLKDDIEIKKDYLALQSIYLNAYHGAYAAINLLNSHQTGSTSTHVSQSMLNNQEVNFYYQMVQLFSNKKDGLAWKKVYKEWFGEVLDTTKKYSDYSGLPKPMPIEYCPKLLKETGWKVKQVGLQNAWKRVYKEDLYSSKRIIKTAKVCKVLN
jgi:lysophospholipase L1-like esterase